MSFDSFAEAHERAVLDLLEQGLSAAVAVAVPIVMAHSTLGLIPWAQLGGVAGGAFIVTVLLGVLTWLKGETGWGFAGNTAAQVAAAFIGSALGLVGGNAVNLLSIDYSHVLNASAMAAFLVLLKCFVARSSTTGPSFQHMVVKGRRRV